MPNTNPNIVEIFTDGSCLGNPGAGGWASLLCYKGEERLLSGGEQETTNNRMELRAAIEALQVLNRRCKVALFTDSVYVQRGIQEWLPKWTQNNWRTSSRQPVANRDLWQLLSEISKQHLIEWHWVKAHSGHPQNERVDTEARKQATRVANGRNDGGGSKPGAGATPGANGGAVGRSRIRKAKPGPSRYSRQICLDTETTGLSPHEGHRVIEIGAVEIIDRRITGNNYHSYFDPEVDSIHPSAVKVHGLTAERLASEPLFRDGVEEFLEFIRDAELIIHNAPFDVGFLNAEMARVRALEGKMLENHCPSIIDSLQLARSMRPGKGNKLDDLKDHYEIDDKRDLHGALIDARILAKVYLCMIGERPDP